LDFYGTRAGNIQYDIRQIPGRYEAYVDFGGESAVPLIADHPNLLVVQTMSKSRALAGLRGGYTLGGVGLIEALHPVKNSFNSCPLGRLAQAGATASVTTMPTSARAARGSSQDAKR
jgi:histidinol-phosphate/aromatic aminotransferase/cobyric acid decarboxylase-like protein